MTTEPTPRRQNIESTGHSPSLDEITADELSQLSDEEMMDQFGDLDGDPTPMVVTGYDVATKDDDPTSCVVLLHTDINAVAYFQPDDEFLRVCGTLWAARKKYRDAKGR